MQQTLLITLSNVKRWAPNVISSAGARSANACGGGHRRSNYSFWLNLASIMPPFPIKLAVHLVLVCASSTGHSNAFCLSCTARWCLCRLDLTLNFLSHRSQSNVLPSCTDEMCCRMCAASPNRFPHCAHSNCRSPPCTVETWRRMSFR